MVPTSNGAVRAWGAFAGQHRPLIALHDAGGSAETVMRLLEPCLGERPVVAVDLPGHGESGVSLREFGPTIRDCAAAAAETLGALGLREAILLGVGTGALIALEIMRRDTTRRLRSALVDLPLMTDELRQAFHDEGMPAMDPVWHGGHLLLAWHLLRDGRLYFPWFRRTAAAARRIEPDLDERRLQLETRDLL
jgi:pimeloyl-ACP methyl ester carboxylesterase